MAENVTLKIKNGSIEIIKFGKGESPLVILPGLSYDGFFAQAKEIERAYGIFKENFTVYLIDRNLYPRPDYTIYDIAYDTAEVFNALNIGKADVFGVSLGGMVAQRFAIDFPDLVNKLVLGSTLSRANERFLSVMDRWKNLAENDRIDSLISDINNTVYSPETLKKFASVFSEIRSVVSKDKTERFIAYVNAGKVFDFYSSLSRIKAETLVIGSLNDCVTTAEGARETAKALKCRYYEYTGYGHAVYDEAPDYKERLFNFFTK